MGTDMGTGTVMKVSPSRSLYICGLITSGLTTSAFGQQAITGSAISALNSSANFISSPSSPESFPEAQHYPAIIIKPRIILSETWSDNVAIGRTQGNKESGFISEATPGVRIEAKTSRLKGYFDYSILNQFYTTPSGYNRTQNSLNSFGTFEAISNWFYLDLSGVIAQQAISAFGAQSTSATTINSNNTETGTFRISPHIRGQIAGFFNYSLRYNLSTTQSNISTASDIDLSEWLGQISGSTPFKNLKWSINTSQQTVDYSRGRATESARLSAMLTYTLLPQFRISLSGGKESNNLTSENSVDRTTHGYGFDWNPTERTQISTFQERRFFGNGHRINISHRFPLSSIRYSDSKDVSVLPNQFASTGLGTVFDLFRQICSQQLSAQYSDPIQLEQAAATCATNLTTQAGVSPNTQVVSSFLASRATIQRMQQLAFAMQGSRNTLTVLFNRNESQTLLAAQTANDDFDNLTSIRQRGYSINLSHQLSGVSNLNLLMSRQDTKGSGNTSIKTKTKMYQVGLVTKLGAKTTGGISVRRTEFDSSISPYTENALVGTISIIF